MKNHLLPAFILGILFLGLQPDLSANELFPVPLTQRVNNSILIAEGKVIAQTSYQEPGNAKGNIYTSNLIQVYRTFKGQLQGEQIEIITEGGTVGRLKQVHSSTLTLSIGETGVFFCMTPRTGISGRRALNGNTYMVYSSLQGFIAYDDKTNSAADPFTRYSRITEAGQTIRQLTGYEKKISTLPPAATHKEVETMGTLAIPVITSCSPLSIPAGTDAVLTITGSNFGIAQGTGFVEFRSANSSNPAVLVQPLPTDYVSWTDTEIKVKVPSTTITGPSAGTGTIKVTNSDPASATSTDVVTIPYAYSNIPDGTLPATTSEIPTHVDLEGTGGYTFQMETSFAANIPAKNAFLRAMKTWTCNTRMHWTLGANTTVNTVASEGVNVVRFDIGSELPAGVLGRCTSWYGGCGTASPFVWIVAEIDMVFDDARPWQYGPAAAAPGEIDFESVAVHELGHGQQLNHIISPGAVMHFAIAAGVTSRVLGAGDIAGGNVVTARGFLNFGCAPAMTPGDPSVLSTPAGTAGGAQVCLNSTVSGGGTTYSDANCNIIARIVPSGALPVSGIINVCTKYESGVPVFNSQAYCERHYDIVPASGAATATATITLYYTQAEFTAYNAANGVFPDLPTGPGDAAGKANLRITQYHGTSGTGLPDTYSGTKELIDPADANIVWNATVSRWEVTFNVTGFSGFFVHTGSFALPLRLLEFSGTISGNNNVLRWATTAEQQSAYFDIQRSSDGVNFSTVGQVTAAGSHAGTNNYQYIDNVSNHAQPTYYYRLKMVDNNAQFTYSSMVKLKRSNQEFFVKVLQNPFRQQLLIDVTSPKLQECVLTLTDMNGRNILQRTVVLQNGNTIIDVPGVQKAGTGAHVLTVVTTTDKRVFKVMKQP